MSGAPPGNARPRASPGFSRVGAIAQHFRPARRTRPATSGSRVSCLISRSATMVRVWRMPRQVEQEPVQELVVGLGALDQDLEQEVRIARDRVAPPGSRARRAPSAPEVLDPLLAACRSRLICTNMQLCSPTSARVHPRAVALDHPARLQRLHAPPHRRGRQPPPGRRAAGPRPGRPPAGRAGWRNRCLSIEAPKRNIHFKCIRNPRSDNAITAEARLPIVAERSGTFPPWTAPPRPPRRSTSTTASRTTSPARRAACS